MMKALLVAIAVMAIVRPENLSGVAWVSLIAAIVAVLGYFAFQGVRDPAHPLRALFDREPPRPSPPK
jgi:hypothetical protein